MEWKDISGFEGLYKVSDTGLIKSYPRTYTTGRNGQIKFSYDEKIMKQHTSGGYKLVRLCKDGVTSIHRVHRLVAIAFLEAIEGKNIVNHINGIRCFNDVSNLEWCDQKYNVEHGYSTGLTKPRGGRKVGRFDDSGQLVKTYEKISTAVPEGFRHDCIVACCRGKVKHHAGYEWRYL